MLFLLHLSLEGITEVDTDPKGSSVSFKVAPSNESSLFVPLQGIAAEREQLAKGRFFKRLQNYMQNKNEGNGNKIMLGDLNCTMDEIDGNGENKTQRFHRCCSNYTLSKLIMDNGIEDLWRRENPDSPEFFCYDRSFAKDQYRPSILIFGKGPIEADKLRGNWVLPSP